MPQTLLALCGLVAATFLTLQSQRHRVLSSGDIIEMEAAQIGARVAVDALNGFRAIPFDEATQDSPVTNPASLHNHATLENEAHDRFNNLTARRETAEVGLTLSASIATLDHADGRVFTVQRATPDGTLSFRVDAVVGYVETDGETPSATATKFKLATVRVTPLDAIVDPVVLSQLYACGTGCNW